MFLNAIKKLCEMMGSHDPMSHMIILWKMWFKVRVTKIHFPSGFSDLTGLFISYGRQEECFQETCLKTIMICNCIR